jgi:hypothetical protein
MGGVGWKGAHHSGLAAAGEDNDGGRPQQIGPELIGYEGVEVVELWTRAAILEVVARLEVHRRQRLMVCSSWR